MRQNFDLYVFPYILGNIDSSEYREEELKTDKERLQFLFDTFKAEFVYPDNLKRYGTYQNCFAEWLKGLPSCFTIAFYNSEIIELAKKWHSLPENPTTYEENKILENYWNFMANKVFKLMKRNKIEMAF